MSPGVSIIPTSNRNMEQEFITYPVSPTTHLLLKDNEDYHRKLESLEGQSFLNNNVIYGALEESLVKDDPKMKDLLLGELKEYNKHRHLSRFSKRRRLEERRLDVDSFQVEPLLQGLGTHYITAWVGTPPQRTTVIVDTGSRFTVFPCKGCEQCGEEYHTDQYFDQDKSSTFKVSKCMECNDDGFYCSEDQCHFGVAYAEGSEWDAYLVSDKFFLGGNGNSAFTNQKAANNAVQYTFGCQTYASGLFVKQLADGIMGMAAHDKSLHHILYEEKKLPNREYSLCFGYSLEVTKQGVYAGMMTLGGSNSELHDHEMVYARDFKDHGWYTVYLRKIYLCHGDMEIDDYDFTYHKALELEFDHKVVNAGPGTIIDSGTTDMYLPMDIFESFTGRWYELVGSKYSDGTFYATEEEVEKLPAIVLQVSGMKEYNDRKILGTAHKIDSDHPTDVIITMPPSYYIEPDLDGDDTPKKRSDGKIAWVSRLMFHDADGVILGSSAIRGYDVHFDIDNHRVGFARSDCNYQKRVLENPDFKDTITTAYPAKPQVEERMDKYPKEGSSTGMSDVDDDLVQILEELDENGNGKLFDKVNAPNVVQKRMDKYPKQAETNSDVDNDFDKYLTKGHDDIDLFDKASKPNVQSDPDKRNQKPESASNYQNSNKKDLFDEMNTPNVEYNKKPERMDKTPSKDLFDRATSPNVVQTRFDKYPKVDLNDRNASCKLINLKVIEPCWKSISVELCHKSSKDKQVVGIQTFRADVFNPALKDDCESVGYTLSNEVSLVQCSYNQYCDVVYTCTTSCEFVLHKGKLSIVERTKEGFAKIGYYGITVLLLGGVATIVLSILKKDKRSFFQNITNKFSFPKKGGYSRLATDKKYMDFDSDDDEFEAYEDDGDCEMKGLVEKKKKVNLYKDEDEESDGSYEEESDDEDLIALTK